MRRTAGVQDSARGEGLELHSIVFLLDGLFLSAPGMIGSHKINFHLLKNEIHPKRDCGLAKRMTVVFLV